MTDEHRAAEAFRLLNEPLLIEAIDAVRNEAMEALCVVMPSDANEIARLQAVANNITEIRSWLEALIAKAADSGFDPNKPTE